MKAGSLLMKIAAVLLLSVFCIVNTAIAQGAWTFIIESGNRTIHVYKPSVESFNTTKMSFRAAISVAEGKESPVFGSMWADADLKLNNSERTVEIKSISIADLRFPDGFSATQESDLNRQITSEMARRKPKLKMDDILADLENVRNEQTFSGNMNNNPPVIIYANKPTVLVTIDGEPIVQSTETGGVEMIVNTPFLILKYNNMYYLGNGSLWYRSMSPLSGWTPYSKVPKTVLELAKSLQTDSENFAEQTGYPDIIVVTSPAELIQTDGAPQYSPIRGTSLNYVSNTEDEILFDINSQHYFVLLSGRWYTARNLSGSWEYVPNENLPANFAMIPEGSDKDAVLASVPGTKAAAEAVRDAQIPQAAIVDRQTATTSVVYDGSPQFESIHGTDMRYASNSSNTVIVEKNRYYVVDNGVWFVGTSPNGPWFVSDSRPVQINIIPPSCPVYNVRYVDIYYVTPQVVYVGYTRGYLSSYVAGHVVVYGTGYHYRPWRGRYYYPRPCTWGFGMNYNPWAGWSVNFCYGAGWFGYAYPGSYYGHHYHHHGHYHYRAGWWGPPVYRPPYCVPYTHYYGSQRASVRNSYYSNMRVYPDRVTYSTARRSNNVYASERRGVAPVRASSAAVRESTQNTAGRQPSYTANYGRSAQPVATRSSANDNTRSTSGRQQETGTRQSSNATSGTTSTRPSTSTDNNRTTTRPSSGTSTGRSSSSSSQPAQSSGSSSTPSRGSSSSGSSSSRQNSNDRGASSSSSSRPTTGTSTGRSNSSSSQPAQSSSSTPARGSSSSSSSVSPSRSSGGESGRQNSSSSSSSSSSSRKK